MALYILVELDETISGLDWPAIFAGTFPDRAFHSLERRGDRQVIVHACSAALASLFLPRDPARSEELAAVVRESLPDLLKRGPDDDDPVDEEDDEDDDDDEAGEDEDEDVGEDEDGDEDDDFEAEANDEVYPDDFLTYTAALLAFAESSPNERVATTTLSDLTKELVALRRLMSLAEENVLDVTWEGA